MVAWRERVRSGQTIWSNPQILDYYCHHKLIGHCWWASLGPMDPLKLSAKCCFVYCIYTGGSVHDSTSQGLKTALCSQMAWAQIPRERLTLSVTLHKLLNLSILTCKLRDINNCAYLCVLRIEDYICKTLHSKYSIYVSYFYPIFSRCQ